MAATKQLQSVGGRYRHARVSMQAVSDWRREGTPARDVEHLHALVRALHRMVPPGSVPPYRRGEWDAIHEAARAEQQASRREASVTSAIGADDSAPTELKSEPSRRASAEGEKSGDHLFVDSPDPWLDDDSEIALRAAVAANVTPAALALYGRWWQLETWLRELVYVELRANFGVSWVSALSLGAPAEPEAVSHMSGPDDANPLAHLDYSELLAVIDDHWDLLAYALIDRDAWQGRQSELMQIRSRIGCLRQPHTDDLNRLEQTLRDLERGAFIAFASYNDHRSPDPEVHTDPVTRGWIAREHDAAQRLYEHVDRQYGGLRVQMSSRPWATRPVELGDTGTPGILWHADVYLRDRSVDPAAIWADTQGKGIRDLVVHLRVDDPHHAGFTFSAADDAHKVADAIGRAFDAVLETARPRTRDDEEGYARFQRRARRLDHRVQSGTGWTIVSESTIPISNFGSGGVVSALPAW
ncbi:hypothetical protein [Rhodococcus opacus]|uniref:hypothetical protein n=1 Tax=Rhodococcus opacus TaxID=37919 RepID=UPI001C205767|nr:hypothetical protein [Rhodococcus opacus]